MRILGKTLVAALFSSLLLTFILLGTLKFQILNKDFLFSSFERNNIYEKLPKALAEALPNDPNIKNDEERQAYTSIAKIITPRISERFLETNLGAILDFINGENKDLKIIIPAKELGIPGAEDINWTPDQMEDYESSGRLKGAFGLGNKILIGLTVILLLLIGLFFLYGRLTIPPSLLGGKTLLLSGGTSILLIGIFGRIGSLFLEKTMPENLEPAQALLKLLATSLLPEIFISWIIIGVVLIAAYTIMKISQKRIGIIN